MDNTYIHITLTAKGIEKYCQDLLRRTSRTERRIAALDSLKTFISVMTTTPESVTDEYAAIISVVQKHFDQAQEELLEEQTRSLLEALQQHSLLRITTLYSALSRDAFWQRLQHAADRMSENQFVEMSEWAGGWLEDVSRRSYEKSPYPDMIDFKAAGIEVIEYTSMSDIYKFFYFLKTDYLSRNLGQ